MIVPVGKGKYEVRSEQGKRLSKPTTKVKAERRLRQIEMFKHMHGRKK